MAASKPRALWLRLRNTPILRMLRLEEALFRADKAHSWFLTNEWDGPAEAANAAVLGISGKVDEMLDVEAVRAAALPVVRRFSGGGTVVVDHDTLFATFIVADDALADVRPLPQPMLEWTGEVYAEALAACGARGFAVRANDYCLGERKFGGNAQSISGRRWLHHTSLLWSYDAERMALLRQPKKQPAYREDRPHGDFVRGLGAALPDRTAFVDALGDAVGRRMALEPVGVEAAEAALAREHRRVTTLVDLGPSTCGLSI